LPDPGEDGVRAVRREETAFAKLTLSLHVGARRLSGLHELSAELVEVSLADSIQVSPSDETKLTVLEDFPTLAQSHQDAYRMPPMEENLAVRAARLLGKSASLTLIKRIPAQAGLGGGSSDAAAVARALGFEGDPAELLSLGSDVPYSLHGGHVRLEGVGESSVSLREISGVLTIFLMPFGLSTAQVYSAFDEVGPGPGPNNLANAAAIVEPRLREAEEVIAASTGYSPLLAGSGSTLFVVATLSDLGIEEEGSVGGCPFGILNLQGGQIIAVQVEIVRRPPKKA